VPWRGPSEPGEFPTLGYLVADLIEAKCAIPDGDHRGKPFKLYDEQLRFLLWMYRLEPPECRRFVYDRGAQLVRPQKWGKGPLAAAIACAEADPEGPVRPDGCDANGEPVGRPWVSPEIQITGISEDNAGNVWRVLVPMIELGALAADIPDTGETRINIPGGGLIKPVTSAHLSRIGQRLRLCIQDQTESWLTSNHGRDLADAQRRNLAGMGGRFLETPNAWDPAENSVAQHTNESHEPGVYIDDVDPGPGSIRNKVERKKMLRRVYGDSTQETGGHVPLERIESEILALLPRDPAQAERWFLNRKRATEDSAFDAERWEALAKPTEVARDTLIAMGMQGYRFNDSLAIVATVVETGYQFTVGAWERPSAADDEYEHPANEIDGALSEAWERYNVWRAYVDPTSIDHLFDRWQGRWGEKKVIPWKIDRPRATAYMMRNYRAAMTSGDLAHDGNATMTQHVRNAKRRKVAVLDDQGRPMWVIGKDRPASPLFVNGAIAGALSWEARGDAIAAGALEEESRELVSW
jgi:hypothetical protein